MKTETIDKIIWPAIFVGLALGGFGLSLRSSSEAIGWALVIFGAVLILGGAALIVLRSRRGDQ